MEPTTDKRYFPPKDFPRNFLDKDYDPKTEYFMIDYYLTENGGCERWVRSSFNTMMEVRETLNWIVFTEQKVREFRVTPEKRLSELVRTFDPKTQKSVEHNSTNRLNMFGSLYEDSAIYITGEQTKMRLEDETPEEWKARSKTYYELIEEDLVYPNLFTNGDS